MRAIIALALASPIYYFASESHNYFLIPICMLLQLLAGLDFKLRER